MTAVPILELTFRNIAGDPWEGEAVARFNGEPGEPFPVREGLTNRQRQDLRWYIEEFLDFPEGGYLTRARRIEREMDEYGHELWRGLQGPEVQSWLGAVQATRSGRLELRAKTKEDEIPFRSPWELLQAGDRLLHQYRVTVVRRPVSKTPKLHPADTSQGLRILVVVCRPDEAGFLDPRYTPQAILKALASRPEVRVDFCRPGTLDELRQRLHEAEGAGAPYHVLHFDGHGTTIASRGGVGALCFEREDGALHLVQARRFGDLMSEFDIPLVMLEACRTSMPSFAQETVASELLRRGVGTVIAMGHAVHVDMTKELMRGFYGALAQGVAAGEALRRARNNVLSKPGRRLSATPEAPTVDLLDWFVPQLYQGGDDPVLLPTTPHVSLTRARDAQLAGFPPPPRAGFEGRGLELHRLERALLRHSVVVLHGPGGMGKTALAREAAHWWTSTGWFEAAIFVSFEGRPSPEKVLNEIGLALEGTDFYKRTEAAEWIAEQFTQRPLLVVWDNFESVLPAFQKGVPTPQELADLAQRWTADSSRILVTCRAPDVPLAGAHPVDLWTLSDPEALGLLARLLDKLGKGRGQRAELGWDAETLQPLIDATGGHPLAIELLSPYLEKFGPAQVAEALGKLLVQAEQEHSEARNRSLWASLEFSIQHLSSEARAALPAMALMAGGCLEAMARDVAGFHEAAWVQVRGELERTGMIRLTGNWLRPHPVLAEVAALAPTPPVEARFFAVLENLIAKSRDPTSEVPSHGMVIGESVARRALDRALATGRTEIVWIVAESLVTFLRRTGRGGEGARLILEVHRRAKGDRAAPLTKPLAGLAIKAAMALARENPSHGLAALEELLSKLESMEGFDFRQERVLALTSLANINLRHLGNPARALEPVKAAREVLEELGEGADQALRASVLGNQADVLLELGLHAEALAVAEEALAFGRRMGNTAGLGSALQHIARILMASGRFEEAEARYSEAMASALEQGDTQSVGVLYANLGQLATHTGQYDEAEGDYRRALEAFERAEDDQSRLRTFNLLGEVERLRGNFPEAQTWYERTWALAEIAGNQADLAAARSNLAILFSERAQQTKDPDEAESWLQRAIAEERSVVSLFRALGQTPLLAMAISNLANFLRQAGQLDEAEELAPKSLAIWERIQSPELWRALRTLELIAQDRGDDKAAAEWRRRLEETKAEAREWAGQAGLGLQRIRALLTLAHACRASGMPVDDALAQADIPDEALAQIRERDPWLLTHLQALAGGETRPEAKVPALYREVVDAAWAAVGPAWTG